MNNNNNDNNNGGKNGNDGNKVFVNVENFQTSTLAHVGMHESISMVQVPITVPTSSAKKPRKFIGLNFKR